MTQNNSDRIITPGSQGIVRFIAKLGYGTRRQVEEMVSSGRVDVDGETVIDKRATVTDKSVITIDGKLLTEQNRYYIAFHKPSGVVTSGPHSRDDRVLKEFIPQDIVGLQPAGRLDKATSGLLLISNDQQWNSVAAGGENIEKEFLVTVAGSVSEAEIGVLNAGMNIPGIGIINPANASIDSIKGRDTIVKIALDEGKLRPIRHLFKAIKLEIKELQRIKIGPVELGSLRSGNYRNLKPEEIEALRG